MEGSGGDSVEERCRDSNQGELQCSCICLSLVGGAASFSCFRYSPFSLLLSYHLSLLLLLLRRTLNCRNLWPNYSTTIQLCHASVSVSKGNTTKKEEARYYKITYLGLHS